MSSAARILLQLEQKASSAESLIVALKNEVSLIRIMHSLFGGSYSCFFPSSMMNHS